MSQSPEGLQHCLDALLKFFNEWKLDLNTRKTKTVIFCRKNIVRYMKHFVFTMATALQNWLLNTNTLEYCLKTQDFLNVLVKTEVDRARKAYYSLKSKIPESDKYAVKTWLKLYKSMVLPILMDQKFGQLTII